MPPFSAWFAWDKRIECPDCDCPGVYVLAHFQVPPPEPADPCAREVVYIGQTTRPLKVRWSGFNISASHQGETWKFGHSGGRHYWLAFRGEIKNLFVAALAFDPNTVRLDKKALFRLEQDLIAAYRARWGEKPRFNTK